MAGFITVCSFRNLPAAFFREEFAKMPLRPYTDFNSGGRRIETRRLGICSIGLGWGIARGAGDPQKPICLQARPLARTGRISH